MLTVPFKGVLSKMIVFLLTKVVPSSSFCKIKFLGQVWCLTPVAEDPPVTPILLCSHLGQHSELLGIQGYTGP